MKNDPDRPDQLQEKQRHFREFFFIPFNAPKHESATMNAKTAPPIGPNNARPKSSATVLLNPTVASCKY